MAYLLKKDKFNQKKERKNKKLKREAIERKTDVFLEIDLYLIIHQAYLFLSSVPQDRLAKIASSKSSGRRGYGKLV
jgi:hypothetical protein